MEEKEAIEIFERAHTLYEQLDMGLCQVKCVINL